MMIGGIVFLLAFLSLHKMKETHGKDMDFFEEG